MPSIAGAKEIAVHLMTSRIRVEGAKELASMADNPLARLEASTMLGDAAKGMRLVTGRDAQLVVGAGVNFANEAAQILEHLSKSVAGGGDIGGTQLSRASTLINGLLGRVV